jgi:hypothetical protein
MNRIEIASCAIRLFAIYAWFQALEYFAAGIMSTMMAVHYVADTPVFGRLVSVYGPSVFFIIVGIFLFLRSRQLGARLFPVPADAAADQQPSSPFLFASIAFAAVGLAIFLYGGPRLLGYVVSLVRIEDAAERTAQFRMELHILIGAALQVVLGFVLVMFSRAFASWWWGKQRLNEGARP